MQKPLFRGFQKWIKRLQLTCKERNGISLIVIAVPKHYFPSHVLKVVLLTVLIAPLAITQLSGCKDKEEIQVYRVSKAELESPGPQSSPSESPASNGAMPAMGATPAMSAPADQPSQIAAKPPANWEPQPLSSMRQASYLVKGDGGATVDISLVILEGPAGGVLENINRWLSQLGQPAMDDAKLAQIAQHVAAPLGDVTVVDLEGMPPGGDAAKDGRIVGGISMAGGKTFFFKMHGNAALAEAQKEAFIHWISSVRISASTDSADAVAPDAAPQAAAPAMPPAAPSADTGNAQIKWDVPDGWKVVPPSSMRYASFTVGGQNGETGEISVVVLGGEGGGDLQNVNRWRGQIGLEPVADDGLKALVVPLKAKDGDILTVDMAGSEARLLAGWTRVDGKSWFFKLTGPDALVTVEKGRFTKFLESVQFHP